MEEAARQYNQCEAMTANQTPELAIDFDRSGAGRKRPTWAIVKRMLRRSKFSCRWPPNGRAKKTHVN
jgi:hypothetical protein